MKHLLICCLAVIFSCVDKPQREESPYSNSSHQPGQEISATSDCTIVEKEEFAEVIKEREGKNKYHLPDRTDTIRIKANLVKIDSVLRSLDTKFVQKHLITGLRDTTIHFMEGTIINVPANAFLVKGTGQIPSGKIALSIKEYYSVSDILLANLTTTTKSELLETGGMIYVDAYSGDDTLALQKDLEISFALTERVEGMQIFYGQRDTSGVMIWEPQIEETESMSDGISIYTIAESQPTFPGGYENLMKIMRKNLRYPSDARRLGLEGTVYVSMVIDADGEVSDRKVLRGLTESLDRAALDAFNDMPAWTPGKYKGKNVRATMVLPVKFRLDGIGQDRAEDNENIKRYFEDHMRDSVFEKISAKVMTHYILSSAELGWINCDRFISKKPRTTFSVLVGNSDNCDVKIIFEGYKSVLPGIYSAGFFHFSDVPLGEAVTVVAIRGDGTRLTLATKKMVIGESIDWTLDFQPVTIKTLKEEIRKLEQ